MKHTYSFLSLLCSLAALLLPACTEDDAPEERVPSPSRNISFALTAPDGWQAGQDSTTTRSGLLAMKDEEGDTLPVSLEVTDGIEPKQPSSPEGQTRSLAYDNTAASFYSTIGAFTYSYDAPWTNSNYRAFTPFMDNVCAKESGGVYVPEQTYLWGDVSDKLIRTFIYSPHSSTLEIDGKAYMTTKLQLTTTGLPQLTYEVPAEASKQPDLMAGYAMIDDLGSDLREKPWAVEFNHILSAVRVKIGSDFPDGIIKSVSLRNVYKNGTYTFGCKYNNASTGVEQTLNGSWSPITYTNTVYTQEVNFDAKAQKDVLIVGGANTWMMIPVLSNNTNFPALLELEFQKDGTSEVKTYKCKLRDFTTTWTAGKTYTYNIGVLNDTEYTFSVDDVEDFEYGGGNKQMKITSYKTLTNVKTNAQTKQAVAWNVTGYSTDGTTYTTSVPSYMALSVVKGNGGTSANNVTAYMLATTPTYMTAPGYESTTLSNATEVTTRRDLSMYDVNGNSTGTQNTANCYVVRAAGQYKIPCVYGNAIKDGTTNSSAYTSTGTTANHLTPFVNGNNVAITDPWLENCGATPANAAVVWQDAPNLVSNVIIGTEDGKKYLYFDIAKSSIQRGNALLAVKDASGKVQWSWHIWITDADFTTYEKTLNSGNLKSTTPQNRDYTLLTLPLGSASGSCTADFVARDAWVKLVQTDSKKELIVKLHQNGKTGQTVTYSGATYYQFGRKDPFPIQNVDGYTGSPRTGSFNWSTMKYTYSREEAQISDGICNPGILYGGSGSFGSSYWYGGTDYANLWDANGIYIWGVYPLRNEAVTKTIYDPSPAGWHVPECGAYGRWNNITTITYSATSASYSLTNNGTTYTLPVLGYRNESTGAITKRPTHAVFWTAACESEAGRNLCVAPNSGGSYSAYITAYVIRSGGAEYTVDVPGVSGYMYSKASALPIMPVKDY